LQVGDGDFIEIERLDAGCGRSGDFTGRAERGIGWSQGRGRAANKSSLEE
jgi:hypothetical protein